MGPICRRTLTPAGPVGRMQLKVKRAVKWQSRQQCVYNNDLQLAIIDRRFCALPDYTSELHALPSQASDDPRGRAHFCSAIHPTCRKVQPVSRVRHHSISANCSTGDDRPTKEVSSVRWALCVFSKSESHFARGSTR